MSTESGFKALLRGRRRRMIELHSIGFALRLPDGDPRFPGLRVVRDALAAGHAAPPTTATSCAHASEDLCRTSLERTATRGAVRG